MPYCRVAIRRSRASRDLVDFIKRFKGTMTSQARKLEEGRKLWQQSFYDHALRREESVRDVARYIWNNPVRAARPTGGRLSLVRVGYLDGLGSGHLVSRAADGCEIRPYGGSTLLWRFYEFVLDRAGLAGWRILSK